FDMGANDWKTIETFFFVAMRKSGWAAAAERAVPSGFKPGWLATMFVDSRFPDLCCVERWSPDLQHAEVAIFRTHARVWGMMRHGRYGYDAAAIPCVQQALLRNYYANTFAGGRGAAEHTQDGFTYYNRWTGDFRGFYGCEFVIGGIHDGHMYHGGSVH